MAMHGRRLIFFWLFIPLIFLTLALPLLNWNSLDFLFLAGINVRSVAASASIARDQFLLPRNLSTKTDMNHGFPFLSLSANDNPKPLAAPFSPPLSFANRAASFFNPSPPCTSRFFMTWISKFETFGQRELLSIESVFKYHPEACLIILSSFLDSPAGSLSLKPLTSLGFRVASMAPDFAYLLNSTPAKEWLRKLQQGRLDTGEIPLGQNLSNLLRLAALYKFGGVYLDTDVIVLKELSRLRNVIGAQSADVAGNWTTLNGAVMVFDKEHPLLYEFIREFALTFNGSKWGHNGPYLASRVVKRLKGTAGLEFEVLPPAAFYPVSWDKINEFFKQPDDGNYEKWAEAKLEHIKRESFTIHLWNHLSKNMEVGEGSLIGRIFVNHCLLCNSSSSSSIKKII